MSLMEWTPKKRLVVQALVAIAHLKCHGVNEAHHNKTTSFTLLQNENQKNSNMTEALLNLQHLQQ